LSQTAHLLITFVLILLSLIAFRHSDSFTLLDLRTSAMFVHQLLPFLLLVARSTMVQNVAAEVIAIPNAAQTSNVLLPVLDDPFAGAPRTAVYDESSPGRPIVTGSDLRSQIELLYRLFGNNHRPTKFCTYI
jgi:hypothetical protein